MPPRPWNGPSGYCVPSTEQAVRRWTQWSAPEKPAPANDRRRIGPTGRRRAHVGRVAQLTRWTSGPGLWSVARAWTAQYRRGYQPTGGEAARGTSRVRIRFGPQVRDFEFSRAGPGTAARDSPDAATERTQS